MKARPRHAENAISKILTEIFAQFEMDAVERIPILGRTGPDITINQSKLIIDVKSRLECPKKFFVDTPTKFTEFFSIPLHSIPFTEYSTKAGHSKMVHDYWHHMHEWTLEREPDGITGIILHRPRVAYKSSVLIIHEKDLRRFQQLWK